MIPNFRKGIFSLKIDEEEKENNLIYELQRLFSYLQESLRRFYNPE